MMDKCSVRLNLTHTVVCYSYEPKGCMLPVWQNKIKWQVCALLVWVIYDSYE